MYMWTVQWHMSILARNGICPHEKLNECCLGGGEGGEGTAWSKVLHPENFINLAPSQGRGSSTHRVCVCVCVSVCLLPF